MNRLWVSVAVVDKPYNIQVKVSPVKGSEESPQQCSHITSIAIGSINLRHHSEEPLDSYQDTDLERLRRKWADTLTCHIRYTEKEFNNNKSSYVDQQTLGCHFMLQ